MPEVPCHYGPKGFTAQLARILECTGCKTQYALAGILGITPTQLTHTVQNELIPDAWLVHLLRLHGINPDWVILGTGPKFLKPSDDPADASSPYECFPPVKATDALTLRRILSCFSSHDLAMELKRRSKRSEL